MALFEMLESHGFLTGTGQDCCNSCAGYRLYHDAQEQGAHKIAFFTEQDVEIFDEGGDIFIGFGDVSVEDFVQPLEYAVGAEIKKYADLCGLHVAWDGNPKQKIAIMGKVH